MARPDMAPVDASLNAVGFPSIVDLLGTYAGRASDLKSWLADAQINLDRNLRLQYLAGMTPDWYKGGPIYTAILAERRFPSDLITGRPAELAELSAVMASGR
jgi:hypothetical protein